MQVQSTLLINTMSIYKQIAYKPHLLQQQTRYHSHASKHVIAFLHRHDRMHAPHLNRM